MRFGVLGPVAVWAAAGEPVPVPGLKVRALLADLLVHEGRLVSADRLIEDLWGDDPPRVNPPAALSAKVSQLRRVLEDAEPGGRDLVVSRPPGYQLHVEPEAMDVLRFRSLTAQARAEGDVRARAALLSEALGLWRGPAFADFGDEAFTEAAIARLDEQRLTAQEDHAEARLALGEHTALAGELGELLAAHPLRERLRAAHMLALYRAGRQSEALTSYAEARTLLADELGLDPGADLVALHQAVLSQDAALAAPAARALTNLPTQLTELIGREAAVSEIAAAVREERLVTLTGPGGVGKTRLALEAARRLVDTFGDGVWLVELAGFSPPAEGAGSLTDVVMSALDIRDATAGTQVSAAALLAEAVRPRKLLLVLDNCEHVLDPLAELAAQLLKAAPDLRILATSREPLGLAGEVVWSVPPLEVPDRTAGADPALLARSSAVRLFVARAAAAARGFELNPQTAAAVGLLCRRLDGLPLALELAATRVRALGVQGVVDRLDDRFRLLATGHRGAPARQQTLMAMIDWSWDLLAEDERAVLRRLAMHADGCTLEAAEAVCAAADVPAGEVPDLLARLVDRSLVVVAHGADGARYRLLESVAAYCLGRLDEAGEAESVRHRHRRYCTSLAETAEAHLRGPEQRRWLKVLDAEAANLRAALDGAVRDRDADGGLRLVDALAWYWFLRGRLTEARRSLDAALSIDAGHVRAPRALAWSAGIGQLQGEPGWAARRDEVLRRYEQADDRAGRARAEWFLAFVGIDSGDLTGSEELLDRSLEVFRSQGDRWGEAAVLITQARLHHVRGELAALEQAGEQAAQVFGELGDRWGQLQATEWLGGLAEMTGDYDRAVRLHQEGLRIARELDLWPEVAGHLSWLGWIAMVQGDYPAARRHCEEGLRLAERQGSKLGAVFAELGLAFTARKAGRFDAAEVHLQSLLSTAQRQGTGPVLYLGMVLIELGYLAEQRGDADSALSHHLRAFEVASELAGPRGQAAALEGLAGALALGGRGVDAARLLGAAATIRTASAMPLSPAERVDVDRITTALGDAAFTADYDAGSALTPTEVAALVQSLS